MYKIKFINGSVREFASLVGANLRGADLKGANLKGADLKYADLRHAGLRYADLRDANLSGAKLVGADLSYADLSGADLRDANLSGASLRGADLRKANLSGADLGFCKGVVGFSGGKHFAFGFKYDGRTYVKIGCKTLDVRTWQEKFECIGEEESYGKDNTKRYGAFINMIAIFDFQDLL